MGRFTNAAGLASAIIQAVSAQSTNGTGVVCPPSAKFSPISAGAFFEKINPGWNVGNTLDAIETEGSWNNPPVVGSTFDDIKKVRKNHSILLPAFLDLDY